MTNIEKVKRILDAGHWVKVTFEDGETTTITSYLGDEYIWIDDNGVGVGDVIAEGSIIEVIQRIPTPYKAGDKVLVLSNPITNNKWIDDLVGNICEVGLTSSPYSCPVWDKNKSRYWHLPLYNIAPAFDDEKDTDLKLSGKEVTVTIDGKEYTATLKLMHDMRYLYLS